MGWLQKNQEPITPKLVQITLGTLLHDCLGDYTFKDGTTRKAIAVNKRQEDVTVTGLEAVLMPTPTLLNRHQNWGFFLVERSQTQGYTDAMYAATEIVKCYTRKGGFLRIVRQNYEMTQFLQVYAEIPVGEIYNIKNELGVGDVS